MTICTLIAYQAFAQITMPVEYEDVLQSRVSEIQNDIKQVGRFSSAADTIDLECHHYPVQSDESSKTVVFVWASEREIHAMRSCLYEQMKSLGRFAARMRGPLTLTFNVSGTFCNRSMNANVSIFGKRRNKVTVLDLYFNDPENDEFMVERKSTSYNRRDVDFDIPTAVWYNPTDVDFNIPTATSVITVRALKDIGRHVRTFVCNSIELTMNKTGKLRQQFFYVTGKSAETVTKTDQNVSASVTLDFDILALNASRPGLLNDSDIEILSLSHLNVFCYKYIYDPTKEYHIIIYNVNQSEDVEFTVSTKAMIVDEKLRLHVNVTIPVVTDDSFGEYLCSTNCKLQTKNRYRTIDWGCFQTKSFYIVSRCWIYENLECKKIYSCLNFLGSFLTIMIVLIAISPVIRTVCKEIEKRFNLKVLRSVTSVLESMKTCNDRIMKYDVFLSYSSKDRPWVRSTLLTFIESKGFKVCFDERDFPPGCSLIQTIAKAVYESRKVIAVVSPNYLKSGWCVQLEFVATYTRILDNEASFNSLLPVKYRDCEMPEYMNCFKYLDYTEVTECDDNQSVVMKLLSCVLPLRKKVNVPDALREKQFFDDLLKWLGKPGDKNF